MTLNTVPYENIFSSTTALGWIKSALVPSVLKGFLSPSVCQVLAVIDEIKTAHFRTIALTFVFAFPLKDSGQAIPRVVESCIRYINLFGKLAGQTVKMNIMEWWLSNGLWAGVTSFSDCLGMHLILMLLCLTSGAVIRKRNIFHSEPQTNKQTNKWTVLSAAPTDFQNSKETEMSPWGHWIIKL